VPKAETAYERGLLKKVEDGMAYIERLCDKKEVKMKEEEMIEEEMKEDEMKNEVMEDDEDEKLDAPSKQKSDIVKSIKKQTAQGKKKNGERKKQKQRKNKDAKKKHETNQQNNKKYKNTKKRKQLLLKPCKQKSMSLMRRLESSGRKLLTWSQVWLSSQQPWQRQQSSRCKRRNRICQRCATNGSNSLRHTESCPLQSRRRCTL